MYVFINKGGNKITEKGSIDLSKANWDALEQIDLGKAIVIKALILQENEALSA